MKFNEYRKTFQISFCLNINRYSIAIVEDYPEFSDKVFSIINDGKEITVIAEEGVRLSTISKEKYFRRITFNLNLPFDLTGFLMHISTLLARKNISTFVISAYSTDHLFVRESEVDQVIELLKNDGMYQLDAPS